MVTARQRRNRVRCPAGYELGGCPREVTDRRFGTLSSAWRFTRSFQIAALNRRRKDEPLDWDMRR